MASTESPVTECAGGPSATCVQRHTLDSPALYWTEGHVLGNGDLGAVVWGSAERVCVGLSKHDVNDLYCPGEHGARPAMTYPQILKRAMAGEREHVFHVGNTFHGQQGHQMPLACGVLELLLLRGIQPHGYRQQLAMDSGQCFVTVVPTTAGWTWGMRRHPIHMRVWVSPAYNVTCIELAGEDPWELDWRYTPGPDALPDPASCTVLELNDGPVGVARQAVRHGVGYATAIASNPGDRGAAEAEADALHGRLRFGGERGAVTLLLACASDREATATRDVVETAHTTLAEVRREGPVPAREQVRAHWAKFWRRSSVAVQDKRMQRLWDLGLYTLGASTRADTRPPHLQGLWNLDVLPPWHCDFHLNTNLQQSQWAAGMSNHAELEAALVRSLVHDWREEHRRFAREFFDAPGLAVPLNLDYLGRPIAGWPMVSEMCITAWIAQHVWRYWRYTRDPRQLREQILPWLREACELYQAILVLDEAGRLNIEVSSSPEQGWHREDGSRYTVYGRNPTIDISCIRFLFEATLAAAELVGADDADPVVQRCRTMLPRLPQFPTADGVLIDLETGFFHDGDQPGRFPCCHRHPSRLMPIFPACQIGLSSDADALDLGRRSYQEFRSWGDDQITGWSLTYQACIAARLGLGADALDRLTLFHDAYMLKGGLSSHNSIIPGKGNYDHLGGPCFQIEALFGAVAAVCQMLAHESLGVIHLFPAVPEGFTGRFERLRMETGVLVDAAMDDGKVTAASLHCEVGGPVRVANPWAETRIELRGPKGASTLTGPTLTWDARTAARYELRPIPPSETRA